MYYNCINGQLFQKVGPIHTLLHEKPKLSEEEWHVQISTVSKYNDCQPDWLVIGTQELPDIMMYTRAVMIIDVQANKSILKEFHPTT